MPTQTSPYLYYNPKNPSGSLNSLLGTISNPADLFGTKVNAPNANTTSAADVATQTTGAATANFGANSALAANTNAATQRSLMDMMGQVDPNAVGAMRSMGKSVADAAANPYELPQAVIDEIKRNSAETGASAGFGGAGSAMLMGLQSREIGVGALDRYNQVLAQTSNYLGTVKNFLGKQTTAQDYELTAGQVASLDTANNQMTNDRQLAQAKAAAAPTPEGQTLAAIWTSLLTSGLQQNQSGGNTKTTTTKINQGSGTWNPFAYNPGT